MKNFIKDVCKGTTIYRALMHEELRSILPHLQGDVVDLAAGGEAIYHTFLSKDVRLLRTGHKQKEAIDVIVDLNYKIQFADASQDGVLCINAVYIIENPRILFTEICRILKSGGTFILVSPFISNEMPDPHDFRRFTAEGLEYELSKAGFTEIKIRRFGERFSAAAYLVQPFFLFNCIRLPIFLLARLGDKLIPKKIREKYPTPLGYIAIVRKK